MKQLTRTLSWSVCNLEELSEQDLKLVNAAKQATSGSWSPYSKFKVGAALLLDDGTIVTGSNQENAAYPSGLCAERTALFSAGHMYPGKAVTALAIAARNDNGYTAQPITPCGACRQVMLETEHRYTGDMRVLLYGEKYTLVFNSAKDLMPLGFFAEDLLG